MGFFLNRARFFEILRSPNDATRQQQLSPGLLNAIFLWGVQFSSDASLLSQEQAFVSLASQSLATALIDPPRDNHTLMIQILQAEVLLSSYFFSRCRDLEGQYHCSAAVSLALSCGLHQIRSSHSPPGDIAPSPLVASRLPAARDATEENERIDAFWAVYVLERSWAFVSGSQIQLTDVGPVQIDTPWPMDGDRAVSTLCLIWWQASGSGN